MVGACTRLIGRFGGGTSPDLNRDLRGTRDWVARFPAEGCAEPGAAGAMSHKDYSTCQHPRKPLFLTTKTQGPAPESWLSGADYPPRKPAQDRLAPLTGKPLNKRVFKRLGESPFGSQDLD